MDLMERTDAEVTRAWAILEELYAELPSNPRVAGARAAAQWTTGRTGTSPLTNEALAPAGDCLVWEAAHANMVALGERPGSRDFAAGVMAWLWWFVGLEPLPRWLR